MAQERRSPRGPPCGSTRFPRLANPRARPVGRGSASAVSSNDAEPCTDQAAVDAAGPVDAQTAPTGPCKTADGFPRASTAIIISLIREERSLTRQTLHTACDRPLPLPSAAAVDS